MTERLTEATITSLQEQTRELDQLLATAINSTGRPEWVSCWAAYFQVWGRFQQIINDLEPEETP